MPPISILIKPASSLCNLNCKYCFYHDVADNRSVQSYGIMSREILEKIVIKAMAQAEGVCSFAFQGGEPTLAGLEFYQYLIELQNRYNPGNLRVLNAIQTNGIAIDAQWAEFFSRHHFLVGLSLDGNKEIHDANRVFRDGTGSFDAVRRTAKLFDRYGVEYNILSVVTAQTCENVAHIYNFYKDQGFRYLQFIPCLDPLGEQRGQHEFSLTPEKYGVFLKTLFDCWYADFIQGNYISIRHFDNWIHMLMGNPPESCGMSGVCTCYFVIEADGSVYPCDFYVLDEFKLGNIQKQGFLNLMKQPVAKEFVEQSRLAYATCKQCKHYDLCRGGCRRDRMDNLIDNYFCSALYDFFDYAKERMQQIAAGVYRVYGGIK